MKLLFTTLLGCLVLAVSLATDQKVKWCVTSQSELNTCQKLSNKQLDLECHLQQSVIDCIKKIKEGLQDAVIVDGENVFLGGLQNYNLHPIFAEKYKKGQEPCYAVAVVKKDTGFTIKDLSGKKSCHCCHKRSGSWNIPIGRLISEKIIPWEGPDDKSLDKAVSEFFSVSCVPGISKANYPNLCKACKGDCSCTPNENYHGGEGAIRCLRDDAGQVAFVCHNAIPVDERPRYELLCLDGSRKSVDDYKNCNLGKEPGRAVISRKDPDLSERIYKLLSQLDLFSTEGGKDLMFSDSASRLIKLPEITDSFLYLKKDYHEIMLALKGKSKPANAYPVQWCNVGHLEKAKCDSLQIPNIECLEANSVDECITKVMRGELDAFAADGGQVWAADKCGLVAAMGEQYEQDKCNNDNTAAVSYYVVAVVKKGSSVTWNNLKGKNSCHTGLNRNAGWKVPQGVLCKNKDNCNLYNFFSKGCAPGAQPNSNMCELCKGKDKEVGGKGSKCKASAEEMFYGYDGAFRCLVEGGGDVAFIKHSIVPSYTDGDGPDWAKNLKSENFELVCPQSPDKTEKITDFVKCNLALVPAHAVITRKEFHKDVVRVLKGAQNAEWFVSTGGRNLMFSDSTKCLQEIPLNETFLTKNYMDIIESNYKNDKNLPELVQACTLNNYEVEE